MSVRCVRLGSGRGLRALGVAITVTALVGRAGTSTAADTTPPPVKAGNSMASTGAGPAVDPATTPGGNEPVSDATARLQVSERPWAVGVAADRQEAALKHLQEGNGLLKESLFVAAAKVYRQALTEWDHPGIHYNLALALLNLDQPVEVYQHLQAAIRFGADPLDPEKLEHAKSYLRIIEKQVASIDVRCDVEGAEVTLDGQPLFRAPGHHQGLLRAGTHTITASKAGFNTTSRTEYLAYDKRTTVNLKLYTAGDLIEYRRRYPIWQPAAVAALGGALLVTGVLFTVQARNNFDAFDKSASNVCANSAVAGCAKTDPNYPALDHLRQRGDSYQKLATASYIAGGIIATAGVLLVVLDRSIPYRVDPEGERQVAAGSSAWLASRLGPLLGNGTIGLSGSGRF
jgi:hypothetical protein